MRVLTSVRLVLLLVFALLLSSCSQATQLIPKGSEKSKAPATSAAPGESAAPLGAQGSVDCAKMSCVALTFDDGPGKDTARLLDMLKREDAVATFFVLGQSAKVHPKVVKRIAAEGHEVGSHTYSHKQLTKLDVAGQKQEIDRGNEQIKAAGVTPTLFRPPYGAYNATTKAEAGLPIIMWDVDTMDWKTRSTEKTIQEVERSTKAGSIVLMHDIHSPTVDAVPTIIKKLRAKGFTLVTVSDLLGAKAKPGAVLNRR